MLKAIILAEGNIKHKELAIPCRNCKDNPRYYPHLIYDTDTLEIRCCNDMFRLTIGAAAEKNTEILELLAKLK